MRWKSTETPRQSIGSVTANVNNLLWVLMLGPILQCYDFKQAVYSTTLKSPLARLLDNLTERGVFLVVRLLPAALWVSLRGAQLCATLPCLTHGLLGWFAMVRASLQKDIVRPQGKNKISAVPECWGNWWLLKRRKKLAASLLRSTLQFCNGSCVLSFFRNIL